MRSRSGYPDAGSWTMAAPQKNIHRRHCQIAPESAIANLRSIHPPPCANRRIAVSVVDPLSRLSGDGKAARRMEPAQRDLQSEYLHPAWHLHSPAQQLWPARLGSHTEPSGQSSAPQFFDARWSRAACCRLSFYWKNWVTRISKPSICLQRIWPVRTWRFQLSQPPDFSVSKRLCLLNSVGPAAYPRSPAIRATRRRGLL